MSTTGSMRVSKAEWYAAGGFRNSRCWRRGRPGQGEDGWIYFIMLD